MSGQRHAHAQGTTTATLREERAALATLTRELIAHRQYRTRDEATQDIFEYIEVFSNRLRRHSTLGYYSPAEFEARTAVA